MLRSVYRTEFTCSTAFYGSVFTKRANRSLLWRLPHTVLVCLRCVNEDLSETQLYCRRKKMRRRRRNTMEVMLRGCWVFLAIPCAGMMSKAQGQVVQPTPSRWWRRIQPWGTQSDGRALRSIMGTRSINCVCRTRCFLLWLSSFLVFSLWVYFWCVCVDLFFKNLLGGFPTIRLWVQSGPPWRTACKPFCWLFNYGNQGNVCSASGFIVKSNNGKRGIASTPPAHVYWKKLPYCCRFPIQPVKDENCSRSGEMCPSEGLQIDRLAAEASQVTIQVLSIDLKG